MPTRREFNRDATLAALGLFTQIPFVNLFAQAHKIKIGQIGTGHSHAEEKYLTLKKLNRLFDLVGIAENDPRMLKAAETKEEYRGARWITEDELFDTPDLQAVLVETDFPDLLSTAHRCIDRGFHVHIDKPPGDSLDGFKSLLEKAASSGLMLQTGYMFRYNPAFRFCIDAVRNGLIGEVFEIDAVISKKINADRRTHLANTYGGGMMLLGCHLIDMMVAVCGRPASIHSYRKQSYAGDNLFDNEVAVFEYPRSIATIKSTLLEVAGMDRRHFIVCGDKGTIEIRPLEPPGLSLTLENDTQRYHKGTHLIELPPPKGRYDDQLTDFALQIRAEKKTDFPAEHELIVHESLLKACEIV